MLNAMADKYAELADKYDSVANDICRMRLEMDILKSRLRISEALVKTLEKENADLAQMILGKSS